MLSVIPTPVLLSVAFSPFKRKAPGLPVDGGSSPVLHSFSSPKSAVKDRLTRNLLTTYQACNPSHHFKFKVPRRMLTHPKKPMLNDGLDNAEANLICSVGDILCDARRGSRFAILDLLGQGTFGQVFKCQEEPPERGGGGGPVWRRPTVAIKVVKNKPAYLRQAQSEVGVLRLLNEKHDPEDNKHLVRLLDSFTDKGHLCLVFELLDMNLYELLKQNQFRGLPLSLIRHFASQILEALGVMEEAGIIHCDLKPENILLATTTSHRPPKLTVADTPTPSRARSSNSAKEHSSVKVIDFGSACLEGRTMYTYIQSRFYRSPEILLGLPYDAAIDMWSLGCICAEMFLGLPIFPGVSEHNQISRVVEMLGMPPEFMLDCGQNTSKYFTRRRRADEGTGKAAQGGLQGQLDAFRGALPGRGGTMALAKVGEEEVAMDSTIAVQGSPGAHLGGNHKCNLPLDHAATLPAPQPLQQHQKGLPSTTLPFPSTGSTVMRRKFALKTAEEYASDTRTPVINSKKYFKHKHLPDIVRSYPFGRRLGPEDSFREEQERHLFLDLVLGLLDLNPWKRWTAKQAARHPFLRADQDGDRTGAGLPYEPPDRQAVQTRRLHAMLLSHQQRIDSRKMGGNVAEKGLCVAGTSSRGPPTAYLSAAASSAGLPPPYIQPIPSEPLTVPQQHSPVVFSARTPVGHAEEGEGVSIFRHAGNVTGGNAVVSVDENLVRSAPALNRLRVMNRRASVGSAVAAGVLPSTPQTAPGLATSGGGSSMAGDGPSGSGVSGPEHDPSRWSHRGVPPAGLGTSGGAGHFLAKGAESYTFESGERLGATDFGYALQRPQMMMQFSPQQQSAMFGSSLSSSGGFNVRSPMAPPPANSYGNRSQVYLPEELDLPPPPSMQQMLHHHQQQQQHQQHYALQHQHTQHGAALSPSMGQQAPSGIEGEFAEWDPFFAEPLEDETQAQLQQQCHDGSCARPRAAAYGGSSPRLPPIGHTGTHHHQSQTEQSHQQQYAHSHHGYGQPSSPQYHLINHASHSTPPKRVGHFSFLRNGGPPRHHRSGHGGSGGTGGGNYATSPSSTSSSSRPRSYSWQTQEGCGAVGSCKGGIGGGGGGGKGLPVVSGGRETAVSGVSGNGPSPGSSNFFQQLPRNGSVGGSHAYLAPGGGWTVRRCSVGATGQASEAFGVSPQPQGASGGALSTNVGGSSRKPPPSPRGALRASPSLPSSGEKPR